MRHVLMLSGGVCSYATGKRLADQLGEPPDMLFADTLGEDADTYRFLVEGAADVCGLPPATLEPLSWLLANIPALAAVDHRLVHLRLLAREAQLLLPRLAWVADGRDIWQVFKDERFLGNSRAAKCSQKLKQDISRTWLKEHCNPADTTIYVGLHWSEEDRFAGTPGKPGARELWLPWRCEAPLCRPPLVPAAALPALALAAGLALPKLYGLGFTHSNCSGGCVKGGHSHFRRLLATLPGVYAHMERKEQEMRDFLGKDVAILRDRTGGKTRPLTLVEFRQREAAGRPCEVEDPGACGCFSTSPE